MSLIDKVISRIENNRTKQLNCIPFDGILPRFSNYIPGIQRAAYYGITGVPSSGKTQLTDTLFLYHALDYAHYSKIEVEIVYFSFEISKERKIIKGISKKLFEKYGSKFSSNYIDSIKESLPESVLEKVLSTKDYFKGLEKYVTFYDQPLTPTQIFKVMEDKARENGEFVYEIKETISPSGEKTRIKLLKEYKPHNPDKYIIFITDHIGLIMPEKGQTLHQALSAYSSNNIYCRNSFGFTIVNVHQQALEGSIEQFTSKGDNIVSKLEPQLATLGDNRTLSRDYDIVLGLFSPYKYEVEYYRGYKTKHFGDNCRFISILKNRDGSPDYHVGFYFDGMINYFEELPRPDEFILIKNGAKSENTNLYEKYQNGIVGSLDPNIQRSFTFI